MGADLVVAMAPIVKTKDEAIAKLKAMEPEVLLGVLSDYFGRDFDEATDEEEYAEAVSFVIVKIEEVYSYYEHGSRDTEVREINGTDWLITGGMSWGDDPTDAYEPVSIVSVLQLTYDEESS